MRVVNRIGVADIVRGAKVPKVDDNGVVVKNENGEVVMVGLDKNKAQDLYLLVGKARNSKKGTTQYGDYFEYYGVFEATRICDGEVFQSGRVILPPPTDSMVENIFFAAKAEDANAEVGFAFIIGTEEHKHGDETKFRYTCSPIPLGSMFKSDPLADLKGEIMKTEAARFLPKTQDAPPAIKDQSGDSAAAAPEGDTVAKSKAKG